MEVLVQTHHHNRQANSFPQWGAKPSDGGEAKPGVRPGPQPTQPSIPQETYTPGDQTTRGEAAWNGFKKGAFWTTVAVGTVATVGMISEGVTPEAVGELVSGTVTCGVIGGAITAGIKAVMHKGRS